MADPAVVFLDFDMFDDSPIAGNLLMFDENPNLGLELPSPEADFLNFSVPQSGDDHGLADANDPILDELLGNIFDSPTGHSQADPSEFRGETSHWQEMPQPESFGVGNPVQLLTWPVPPVPFSCSCCQVLREITHTNGVHVTKLEVHGRLGMISHAILETQHGGDWTSQNHYQMFDFCKKSIEDVREFLVQYCADRKQAGFIMFQDPLLVFYEALCVGLTGGGNLDTVDVFQPPPADFGGEIQEINQLAAPVIQPEPVNQSRGDSNNVRLRKRSLAAQRERTGKLGLKDLIRYFHYPINDAAKRMEVCSTVIKKICRKHKLSRWPYRKVKKIGKQISRSRARLNTSDAEERARAQAEIEEHQQELARSLASFSEGHQQELARFLASFSD